MPGGDGFAARGHCTSTLSPLVLSISAAIHVGKPTDIEPGPCGWQPTPSIALGVITSYSIHYTKLYEVKVDPKPSPIETSQTRSACRITSYNVCYTKLLRNEIL